ncbi:MAG TPA: shikimate dehydrogenase [Anaerolineales bacterium]|nr:shikimate dehydrogenase [Anaerolineales bacterium]
MIQLGLTGYPLGHSLSPRIHKAALDACGLPGKYSLFPIEPDDPNGLKEVLDRVRTGEISGLNVTIPHKQNVIPYLDELTQMAQTIGAVNTVYLRDNRLIGENTDAPGFLSDLNQFLSTETRRHGEYSALVLGAGGSARAVVYALVTDGWQVTVAARRLKPAEQLAALFDGVNVQELNLRTFQHSNLHLIVNTTPVGMTPHIHHSPWPENIPFPTRAAIYDLVYNPRQTKLVRDACAQGLSATTGLGMLVEQAALSFELWTGCQPPRDILFEAVNQTAH